MARTSTRRWKGCQLCKPHKHASNGDTERTPYAARRRLAVSRRFSRNDTRDGSNE